MTIGLENLAPEPNVGALAPRVPVASFERVDRGELGQVLVARIGRLRQALALDDVLDDQAILASLEDIARFSDPYARWQAAFDSTLGLWLALTCSDVEAALAVVVAAVPSPS